jgi:hypothetical protein
MSPDFFSSGTEHLMYCWDRCPSHSTAYVKKKRVCPLFLVLVYIYGEVVHTSLTHPWMLFIQHPTVKVKVKLSLCLTKCHAMKTYWGSGGITPCILDLATR